MTAAAKNPGAVAARTLVRGLSILEIVATAAHGIGVTEVAEAAGLDKGTASRLLATLRELGYVQQRGADRRYVLGSRCLWLAHEYQASQEELILRARPHIATLRDETNETVHLAVREGLYVVYVAQEEPDRSIRVRSAVGTRMPLQDTAMGRAILAMSSDHEREALLDLIAAEAKASGRSIDFDAIRREVLQAAERGWSSVDRHDDVTRIAAAIRGADGEPIAAIAASGPSYRIDDHVAALGEQVAGTAQAISRAVNG